MKRLDEIEARTNTATEGPWEVEFYWDDTAGYEVEAITAGGTKGVIAPPWNSQGDVSIEVTTADAEFIAHARTDMPALVAALRAVLELHPREVVISAATEYGLVEGEAICAECIVNYEPAPYPCPTVAAIRQHLGGDD